MGFFGRLLGGGDAKLPYPPSLQPQIEKAVHHLTALTAAHDGAWHIGEADWSVDQDAGTIVFEAPNGVRAIAPAQIIGDVRQRQETWLWAWDNPSELRRRSPRTRGGSRRSAASTASMILTTRKLTCSEEQCWELAALVACLLCGAQGAYRGPADDALIFFTFGEVALSQPA